MISKIVALALALGLAAVVVPAVACDYGISAQNSQSTSQQTAQSQPAGETGSN